MKYLKAAVAVAGVLSLGHAYANQGDIMRNGSVGPELNENGNYRMPAAFRDHATGDVYHFFLEARQTDAQSTGDMTLGLRGPGLNACSVHGSHPNLRPGTAFAYGNPSGESFACGTASHQTVKIDGCTALIQAHGFIHADAPHVNTLALVTMDIRYRRKPDNPASDDIEINIYTPKQSIKLAGQTELGATMPSCSKGGQ